MSLAVVGLFAELSVPKIRFCNNDDEVRRGHCDAAYVLDGAMDRSVFAKRPMSSQLVIISGILRQDPA
jgi:hypothetical protein